MASRAGIPEWSGVAAWRSRMRLVRGEGAPVRWGTGKVSEGNVAIICDIATKFVRFLELADSDSAQDLAALVASDHLHGRNPTSLEAFSSYAEALSIDNDLDDAGSAQTMLRGNLLVAHHEQSLADDFVDGAMPLGGLFGVIATRFVTLDIPEGSLDLSQPVPRRRYLHGERWPLALS